MINIRPPSPHPHLHYFPSFSFRPFCTPNKTKTWPTLHLNTQKSKYFTTKFHFINLKKPTVEPILNLKKPTPRNPLTSYSFFCLLWYTFTSHWYCYQPPKLSISPYNPPKKKKPNQFFLSSCFLKQITQHISLSNFRIWNLVTAWWVFLSFLSTRPSSLLSVFFFFPFQLSTPKYSHALYIFIVFQRNIWLKA